MLRDVCAGGSKYLFTYSNAISASALNDIHTQGSCAFIISATCVRLICRRWPQFISIEQRAELGADRPLLSQFAIRIERRPLSEKSARRHLAR